MTAMAVAVQEELFSSRVAGLDSDLLPVVELNPAASGAVDQIDALISQLITARQQVAATDSGSEFANQIYLVDVLSRHESLTLAVKQRAIATAIDHADESIVSTVKEPRGTNFIDLPSARRAVGWSLGPVLMIPTGLAEGMVDDAIRAVGCLANGQARLANGDWSWAHQRAVLEATAHLDDATVTRLDADLFHRPGRVEVRRVREQITRWLRRHSLPTAGENKRREGPKYRYVGFGPADDYGMRSMHGYLRAADATMIENVLKELSATAADDDPRNQGQLAADVFVTLFTGPSALSADVAAQCGYDQLTLGPAEYPVTGNAEARMAAEVWQLIIVLASTLGLTFPRLPTTNLNLHVPVSVLTNQAAGTAANPSTGPPDEASIRDTGTINDDLARLLMRQSVSIRQVLVDPDTRAVLSYGRARRLPTPAMAARVRIRDGHCRYPGCTSLPVNGEIDHVVAYASGGETADANLQLLCANHHQAKHQTHWQPVMDAETAEVTWTNKLLGTRRTTSPN